MKRIYGTDTGFETDDLGADLLQRLTKMRRESPSLWALSCIEWETGTGQQGQLNRLKWKNRTESYSVVSLPLGR